MSTRTRFEKQAKGNSEMAYCFDNKLTWDKNFLFNNSSFQGLPLHDGQNHQNIKC